MDVSQLYMLALRPGTRLPIVGESTNENGVAGLPSFVGQIEVDSWSWDFHNEERQKKKDAAGASTAAEVSALSSTRSPGLKGLKSNIVNRNEKITDKRYNDLIKPFDEEVRRTADSVKDAIKSAAESGFSEAVAQAAGGDGDAGNNKPPSGYTFKFSKRVDASTTQLLNCMKVGDQLPTVTLTMHQASSNTPWSLVITVTNLRLTSYTLEVDAQDTMTDMKENWEATFDSFGYVYQNRPHAGVKSMTAGNVNTQVARAATQATVRTFMMKNMKLF